MKKITIFTLVILFCVTLPLFARLGGAGANFLEIGSGGRASALGNAYVAVSDNLEGIFYNPSGIAYMSGSGAMFSYTPYFADMSYQTGALSFYLNGVGTIGLSFQGLQSGDIGITTIDNQNGGVGDYSANDYAFGFSFARQLTDKFAAGATFKMISQGIDEVSALGWAVDLGATYNTGWRNLRVGFSVLNFGPDIRYEGDVLKFHSKPNQDNDKQKDDKIAQWETGAIPLPLTFTFGLAYDVFDTELYRLTATLDQVNPSGEDETFAIGMELTYLNKLFLRGGYSDRNNKDFTAGAGAIVPMGGLNAIVDYSFQNHEYLDPLHSFMISFQF